MATGTKVADVFVDIGYDLTNYKKGLAEAKKESESIGGQIRKALSQPAGTTTAFKSGFANVIQDLRQGTPLLTAFQRNLPGVARDLKSLTVSGLKTGLNEIGSIGTKVFGGLRSLATNVFKGIAIGIGIETFLNLERVISRVVQAFPELISRGMQWTEAVHTMTLATGASAEATSRQAAIYKFLGGSTEQYTTQVVRLSARIKANEETLNKWGVVTKDANGNMLDSVTIADHMRSIFSKLPDGVDKTAIAFKLFGQRGAQMFGPLIHFLGLTDEQVKVLGDDVERQGLVVSEEATKIADATEKAHNRMENAITGLATKLFEVLGPGITRFFDGLAQTITDNAKEIEETLGSVFNTILGFVEGLVGITPALNSFSEQFPRIGEGGAATSATLVRLTDELGELEDTLDPATDVAKNFNDALDAQTTALQKDSAAIDEEIAWLKKQDAAQETLTQRTLSNLAKVYQAKLDALDLAERERASLRSLHDLNEQLNDAMLALAKAQTPDEKTGVVDAEAVSAAYKDIEDIRARQAELTRDQALDEQRQQIETVKGTIEAIAKLEAGADADHRKALAKDLADRRKIWEERLAQAKATGDTTAIANITDILTALTEAQKRNTEAIKAGAAVDELTARKQQLADEVEALRAARVTEAEINREATKTAIALKEEEIRKEQERINQEATDNAKRQAWLDLIQRRTGEVLGPGPTGVSGLFEEARLSGVKFADDVRAALEKLFGVLGDVAGAIGGINFAKVITDLTGAIRDNWGLIQIALVLWTAMSGDPRGILIALGMSALKPGDMPSFSPIEDWISGKPGGGPNLTPGIFKVPLHPAVGPPPGEHQAGGPVWMPELAWHAEKRPEYIIPDVQDAMARLDSLFRGPMPAPAGGSFLAHGHDIIMNERKVGEAVAPTVSGHVARLVRR